MKKERTFRLVILGAGFSNPAGLPLNSELFGLIRKEARKMDNSHGLEEDIDRFLAFKSAREGRNCSADDIDLESFISFLDIEHFLLLQGSDTWTSEGNRTQILIRNLICKILFSRQLQMSKEQWSLYEAFVSNLNPDDIVITLNYDTILEESFKKSKIPFRYAQNARSDEAEEVILLKMHGSINWFDIAAYNRETEYFQSQWHFQNSDHPVFQNYRDFFPKKIVQGAYADNPLNKIYYILDVQKYLNKKRYLSSSPLIISPSHAKMVYLNPLREFWYGFNKAGYYNNEMIIIGFSFNSQDEYLLVPIVQAVTNFQKHNRSLEIGYPYAKLKIVDYKETKQEIKTFKKRLPFINWNKTEAHWEGLTSEVIDKIFKGAS